MRFVSGLDSDDELEDEERLRLGLAAALVLGALDSRLSRAINRRQTYLTRPELMPDPRINTPWQRLWASQSDRAFITTMGIDVATFHYLLDNGFAEIWATTAIPRTDTNPTGQPRLGRRSLDAAGALGLYLHYLNSTMLEKTLQELFALVPGTTNRYLKFARLALLKTLRNIPEGKIKFPRDHEFHELSKLVQRRHPLLNGAFGGIDGLNLATQASDDPAIENATYNGWLHDHFTSCVLVFSAKGVIISCNVNAPGSWHDAKVARPIYEQLRNKTPEGYFLVADSAFPQGGAEVAGRIQSPRKSGAALPRDRIERAAAIAYDNQLLSYRQTAEWGMRQLQGSFGRLRIPLDINDDDGRADLLENCVRMNNVRVQRVGISQVRNVYEPMWRASEAAELWDSFERMLIRDIRRGDRVARFHVIE